MTAVPASLGPLAAPPISRTTLALFAGASGDHNPVHIDIDAAKAAGFADVFAPGMLSMAYLGRLFTITFGPGRLKQFRVRFTAVTPLHAEPMAAARLVEIRPDQKEATAVYDTTISLADGTVTLIGQAEVAIGSRTPSDPEILTAAPRGRA